VLESVATDNPTEREDPPVRKLKSFGYQIGGEPGDQVSIAAIPGGIESQQEHDHEQGAELYQQV
jgi:hypothetical protein